VPKAGPSADGEVILVRYQLQQPSSEAVVAVVNAH